MAVLKSKEIRDMPLREDYGKYGAPMIFAVLYKKQYKRSKCAIFIAFLTVLIILIELVITFQLSEAAKIALLNKL